MTLPDFSQADYALLAVSAVGFLGHLLIFDGQPPGLLKALVKMCAVGPLAAIAYLNGAPWLLVAGLAFSTLGDGLLVGEGDRWLLPGMAAFFAAHLAYFVLFLSAGDLTPNLLVAGIVVAAGIAMLAWLGSSPGGMRVPVMAYTAMIVAMAVAAATLEGHEVLALYGALFFMLSDALLAGNLFRLSPRAPARKLTTPLVWFTYVLAQGLIGLAFLPG